MAKVTIRQLGETLSVALYHRVTVAMGFPKPLEVLWCWKDEDGREQRELLATFATDAMPFMGQMVKFFSQKDALGVSNWEKMMTEWNELVAMRRSQFHDAFDSGADFQMAYSANSANSAETLRMIQSLKRRWLMEAIEWIETKQRAKAEARERLKKDAQLVRLRELWARHTDEPIPDDIEAEEYKGRIRWWNETEVRLRNRVYDPFDDEDDEDED